MVAGYALLWLASFTGNRLGQATYFELHVGNHSYECIYADGLDEPNELYRFCAFPLAVRP